MLTVKLVGTGEKKQAKNLNHAKKIINLYLGDTNLLCAEVVDEEGEIVYFVDIHSDNNL